MEGIVAGIVDRRRIGHHVSRVAGG
jgi:hypothetical protein